MNHFPSSFVLGSVIQGDEMIDIGASNIDSRNALTLDQQSTEFLDARSAGGLPLLDAFYGQFLDPLPPVSLQDLLRRSRAA